MPIDQSLIKKLLATWKNCYSTTSEFAQNTPSAKWNTKPFFPRFKTFSWEFACIVRTRLCYLKAFRKKILKFSSQPDIPNKNDLEGKTKSEVIKLLKKSASDISQEIKKIK